MPARAARARSGAVTLRTRAAAGERHRLVTRAADVILGGSAARPLLLVGS